MANTNYPSASDSESYNSEKNPNRGKNVIIGLLIAALLGTWAYILWNKNTVTNTIQEKNVEIATAMTESDSLRQLFNLAEMRLDSITGANNMMQGTNSALKKEIEAKRAEITKILSDKNATTADLNKARKLIGELNGQISRLEFQVAKLRGENQQLTAQNSLLTSEKVVLDQNLQTKVAENDELANTIDVGSTLSASGMVITPIDSRKNGKEKKTTIARKVDLLKIAFTVENRITSSGPADLYIIVTDPKGKIIQAENLGSGIMTTRNDGERNFTTKVPIEYEQGTKKAVTFSIKGNEDFSHGDYKIEVYHNGFKIGEGIRSLRKNIFG